MLIKPIQKVKDYFQSFESKVGYDLTLWGYKHFGYHPIGKKISEREAVVLTQEILAQKLKLTNKDVVLDAGCGQGRVACHLAKKYGCKVTGITIVPFEVKKAKEYAEKVVEDKVKFLERDYLDTKFPDESFTAIFTMESLVHSYDLKKTLIEFKRLLKPKGRLAIFDYSITEDKKIDKFLSKFGTIKHDYYLKFIDRMIEKSAMYSFKTQRHGVLPKLLKELYFTNINEENVVENMWPSAERLHKIAYWPNKIIKLLHLQEIFFNTTVAAEFMPLIKIGMKYDFFRYNITTAQKS